MNERFPKPNVTEMIQKSSNVYHLNLVACGLPSIKASMQASSPGCSCGGVGKEGELVTMSLEF